MKAKKVSIIGSGFASLSAACYLAQAGYAVEVFEKNAKLGGRARQFKKGLGPMFYQAFRVTESMPSKGVVHQPIGAVYQALLPGNQDQVKKEYPQRNQPHHVLLSFAPPRCPVVNHAVKLIRIRTPRSSRWWEAGDRCQTAPALGRSGWGHFHGTWGRHWRHEQL